MYNVICEDSDADLEVWNVLCDRSKWLPWYSQDNEQVDKSEIKLSLFGRVSGYFEFEIWNIKSENFLNQKAYS